MSPAFSALGGEVQALSLETIDERYRRYRLQVAADEVAVLDSLKRFGQISPVVVSVQQEQMVLIDGFKHLRAARQLRGMATLVARCVELDERGAKAALFLLNQTGRVSCWHVTRVGSAGGWR